MSLPDATPELLHDRFKMVECMLCYGRRMLCYDRLPSPTALETDRCDDLSRFANAK